LTTLSPDIIAERAEGMRALAERADGLTVKSEPLNEKDEGLSLPAGHRRLVSLNQGAFVASEPSGTAGNSDNSGSSSASGERFQVQLQLHPIQEEFEESKQQQQPQSFFPVSVDAQLASVGMNSVSLMDFISAESKVDLSSARGRAPDKSVSFSGINKSFGLSMRDVR